MNNDIKQLVFCLISSLLVIAFLSGCNAKSTTQLTQTFASTNSSSPALANTVKGVSLSPRSYDADDFQPFFPKAK